MAYTVNLKRSAEKELELLPKNIHDKIVNALLFLKNNPFPYGVKKLHGREGYRIRVGSYRVLYLVEEADKKIEIVSIAHRKDVYR